MCANAGASAQFAAYHHPPPLFVWLWVATFVSDQEWWLRLVPTLAGGLVPMMAALWMRRFLNPITAWGLAALLAFAPNLVLLSIQLRGYSMAMLATLGASMRWTGRSKSVRRSGSFGILSRCNSQS